MAQSFNVKVVRIRAQFDQADELAVWDISSPNTRGRPPVLMVQNIDVFGKPGMVRAQGDIVAGSCAWISRQVPPHRSVLVLSPQPETSVPHPRSHQRAVRP
jgi:hypothetical protein